MMSKRNVNEELRDVVIVGGGPAGLAAALVIREKGLNPLIIEREIELGGILRQCIHTGFGLRYFKEELSGPEYAQRFINLINEKKIEFLLNSNVINISPKKEITIINSKKGIFHIKAKAIILAMGCRERTRGAINIPGTRPAGIFPAGQAQKFINIEGYIPGKRVLILGSGDIGMIMARRCTIEGMKVLAVAEVLSYPSGLKRNQVQCLDDYEIPLFLRHTITDIRGKERIEGATIMAIDEKWRPVPGTEKYYDCDTILFSVGLIPENELSSLAGCKIAQNGGPIVNEYLQTSIPGIFACGNVLQVHDLVDWVTEEAERAGNNAALYSMGELRVPTTPNEKHIQVIPGENVGYVVPEIINHLDCEKLIKFSYRVKNPRSNIKTELIANNKIIYTRRHIFVLPSEMINITARIDPKDITNEIIVNVIEKEQTINIIEKEILEGY